MVHFPFTIMVFSKMEFVVIQNVAEDHFGSIKTLFFLFNCRLFTFKSMLSRILSI